MDFLGGMIYAAHGRGYCMDEQYRILKRELAPLALFLIFGALGFFLHARARVIFGILLLIFFDPCAGRHLLSLLRQRK